MTNDKINLRDITITRGSLEQYRLVKYMLLLLDKLEIRVDDLLRLMSLFVLTKMLEYLEILMENGVL